MGYVIVILIKAAPHPQANSRLSKPTKGLFHGTCFLLSLPVVELVIALAIVLTAHQAGSSRSLR